MRSVSAAADVALAVWCLTLHLRRAGCTMRARLRGSPMLAPSPRCLRASLWLQEAMFANDAAMHCNYGSYGKRLFNPSTRFIPRRLCCRARVGACACCPTICFRHPCPCASVSCRNASSISSFVFARRCFISLGQFSNGRPSPLFLSRAHRRKRR
jgi:hypothetical protein